MLNKSKTSSNAATKAKRTPSRRMKRHPANAPASRAATSQADAAKPRGQFVGLSIKQLQAMYLEVVGRPTGSRDRNYLTWKMREAKAGRVPVGPRTAHAAADMTTLPFRVPIAASEAMDEVWRANGSRSRNRFIEEAVARHLTDLGASDAAKLFAHPRAEMP